MPSVILLIKTAVTLLLMIRCIRRAFLFPKNNGCLRFTPPIRNYGHRGVGANLSPFLCRPVWNLQVRLALVLLVNPIEKLVVPLLSLTLVLSKQAELVLVVSIRLIPFDL